MENYRRKYTPRYPDFGECLDQFGEPDRRRLDIIIKEIRKTESETKTWDSDRRNAENLNITAVSNLAKLATNFKIKLIHISTDYVFDGTSSIPYS